MSKPRAFPQSAESERALLGGLILDPNQIEDIHAILAAEDFYRPDHAALFTLLDTMRKSGDRIDMVSVPERVVRNGEDQYGGMSYVLRLTDAVPSTTNLDHYARVILDKSQLRRVIAACQATEAAAYAHEASAHHLVDHMTRSLADVMAPDADDEWVSYSDAVDDALYAAESARDGEALTFLPTGHSELDYLLGGGLPIGLMFLIAARPAMGKSALAFCIAENVGRTHGVACFLAEDNHRQVANRAMARETGIDASDIRAGKIDQRAWDRLRDSELRARGLDIHINRNARFSARDIRAKVRGLNAKRAREGRPPIRLVIVDYLQLMELEAGETQNIRVSGTSRELTLAAKELEVHMLVLSQLNREVEKRSDKRPIPSDLRDSGALEQDCRGLIFPYRPHVYEPDAYDPSVAELDVAKNTYGRGVGMVPAVWDGPRTKFSSPAESALDHLNERATTESWDDAPPLSASGLHDYSAGQDFDAAFQAGIDKGQRRDAEDNAIDLEARRRAREDGGEVERGDPRLF